MEPISMLFAVLGLVGVRQLFKRRARVTVHAGKITGPTGAEYVISPTDRLWLARAILGETGTSRTGGAAVAWALAQNFMLVRGGGERVPRFSSFAGLIRAYCQPVNPAWADPTGPKCQAHPELCTPQHIARRRRISSMGWGSIPAAVRDLVVAWMAGSIANPVPGMVDWAAFDYDGGRKRIGGNLFGVVRGRRLV